MSNIKILDCTLRDGGYINNWKFGKKNIDFILNKLDESNVDFVELGYLDNSSNYSKNETKYSKLSDVCSLKVKSNKKICMIDYGKFDIELIPNQNETDIFGIRVAFSKDKFLEALQFCKELKQKNYKIFVQPMVTNLYGNEELEILLSEVNKLKPYAIYIVDSFGSMNENDVVKLYKKYEEMLDKKIKIGFHSHNNLQLAFSNSKNFIENAQRDIIIDSSVYGIGRGAGNLATELIINYLNSTNRNTYARSPLLEIVDFYLNELKKEKNWGYCLEYYISAVMGCHPNYSRFLSEMHTMTVFDMKKILMEIDDSKKSRFDLDYIKKIYSRYMNRETDDNKSIEILRKKLKNKKIIILGNGRTILNSVDIIKSNIDDNTIVISVNYNADFCKSNYIFISNNRRFNELEYNDQLNIVCTSNVDSIGKNTIVFDYLSNLATEYEKSDNALLILLNILLKVDVSKVFLAGFDGFNSNGENFYKKEMSYEINAENAKKTNKMMSKYLKYYSKKMEIRFLTKSIYEEEI